MEQICNDLAMEQQGLDAVMGASTFAWSYTVRRMEVPDTPVRLELMGPSGDLWAWGPEEAKNMVKGLAERFLFSGGSTAACGRNRFDCPRRNCAAMDVDRPGLCRTTDRGSKAGEVSEAQTIASRLSDGLLSCENGDHTRRRRRRSLPDGSRCGCPGRGIRHR